MKLGIFFAVLMAIALSELVLHLLLFTMNGGVIFRTAIFTILAIYGFVRNSDARERTKKVKD